MKNKAKIHASHASLKSDTYIVPMPNEKRKTSLSSGSSLNSEMIDNNNGKVNSFWETELICPSSSSKPGQMTPSEVKDVFS